MAIDKVIDSAKLDTALTATANAIREKNGSADPIAWDNNTGFANAVENIEAGGGGSEIETFIGEGGSSFQIPMPAVPSDVMICMDGYDCKSEHKDNAVIWIYMKLSGAYESNGKEHVRANVGSSLFYSESYLLQRSATYVFYVVDGFLQIDLANGSYASQAILEDGKTYKFIVLKKDV